MRKTARQPAAQRQADDRRRRHMHAAARIAARAQAMAGRGDIALFIVFFIAPEHAFPHYVYCLQSMEKSVNSPAYNVI